MHLAFLRCGLPLVSFLVWLLIPAMAAPAPTKPRPQMALPGIGEEVPLRRIKQICEFYGLRELWRKIERDPPPQPFKSDGCTGWFDDWKGVSLYPAGFLHDLKYWAGYPNEDVERLVADAELMIDVARLLGSTEMAETMFHGVRVGGAEHLNAPFSWGFGRKHGEAISPAQTKTNRPVPPPAKPTRQ
jgi:hypothetical protein